MSELAKTYQPADIEGKWYAWWEQQGLFHGAADRGGKPYCIVIPPPNITGILHIGHALNNTIQDVLIRWRRMQGCNTVWVPGTDHAGIATQNVVERQLKTESLTRDALGREAFLERVWQWREKYGNTIISQLRQLGASCDWERLRFTMDEGLSRAVTEVFVRLYEKGLIYRGHYIINWCPRCQTALSDEESEHKDTRGKLYYIRYPLKGGRGRDGLVVATTRPETLLGDVAVAVNPRDPRYAELHGRILLLPVLKRECPVITDDFVDPEFGTGAVKVTPAHDPNDFDMGRRHSLDPINIMNDDGTLNEQAGPYAGLDRFECRKRIVADLKEAGLLEDIKEHQHAVGHCYRCATMVEPRLSRQWFVKMKPLAQPAMEAVRSGRIRFVPERWTKVYLDWMENIRDWCISRQIWWGHRIPVYYCDACGREWAARARPAACPQCGSAVFRQDEDVLDTWFSSWLWPFSVWGWPDRNPDMDFYYPTHTLVTASEIIFFWVARMIMAGLEFMGEIPFTDVYIHGTVRDDQGRKMSKSLGNSIDPLSVIDKYSADALRFSLLILTATGQDVFLSDDKFEIGRNFGTKIWNAARYLKMQTGDARVDVARPDFNRDLLRDDDAHLIMKLQETIAACTENLERFRFNDAAKALYEFVWGQYCDWYVEYSKAVLYGTDAARRAEVLKVMHYVFSQALRLLHPMMPFLTEELWHGMGYQELAPSIMRAPWPTQLSVELIEKWGLTDAAVAYVDGKHDLIHAARNLVADFGIQPKQKVEFMVRPADADSAARLERDRESLVALLRAHAVTIQPDFTPGKGMPGVITRLGALHLPLAGLIDIDAETQRLADMITKIDEDLQRVANKLNNRDFTAKAPREVVAVQENRKKELLEKRAKIEKMKAALAE